MLDCTGSNFSHSRVNWDDWYEQAPRANGVCEQISIYGDLTINPPTIIS